MSNSLISLLTIIFSIVSIQFGASMAKSLFPVIGAPASSLLRLVFAAIILVTIWRPWRFRFTGKTYKAVLIYGVSLGLMNLLFYMALERIPLGIAVALEFTGPLAVTFYHSRKKLDFFWAIIASVGILMLVPLKRTDTSLDAIGVAFALSAGFCWAMYILFGKKAGENVHGGVITSLGMVIATIVVIPPGFLLSKGNVLEPSIIPLAIMVAIFSSALPYSLEMIALKKIPAKAFGILMSLEPAIAALMGLVFLQEILTWKEIIAIGLVISASLGGALLEKETNPPFNQEAQKASP